MSVTARKLSDSGQQKRFLAEPSVTKLKNLFDPGGLTSAFAEVENLVTANFTFFHDFDLGDRG